RRALLSRVKACGATVSLGNDDYRPSAPVPPRPTHLSHDVAPVQSNIYIYNNTIPLTCWEVISASVDALKTVQFSSSTNGHSVTPTNRSGQSVAADGDLRSAGAGTVAATRAIGFQGQSIEPLMSLR